jgi:hypothetical protein
MWIYTSTPPYAFIVWCLIKLSRGKTLPFYIASNNQVNWKVGGREPNLSYYAAICLKGQGETTNRLSQDGQSTGRDSGRHPPK